MQIDLTTMDKMHDIQYEMLIDLIRVMDRLQINYYFVHGSLLGTVRDNDFIAEDDDIDIALFREDYNKLFSYGTDLLKKEYFLQNSTSDMYPLPFGKLRNSKTTFIQPILGKIKCNQGVYIDIFPIDYECNKLGFRIKKCLLDCRCFSVLTSKKSVKAKTISMVARLVYPNYYHALLKREILYSQIRESDKVCIFGGKPSERNMNKEWFDLFELEKFKNCEVKIPIGWKAYLERIYGPDYMNHNPAVNRIHSDEKVEISAEILDFDQSYNEYV